MGTFNSLELAGMKALSIIMPWPWLILKDGKDIENRSWFTNYRGKILIHASKKPDPNYLDILKKLFWEGSREPSPHDFAMAKKNWEAINQKWCGHIVGSVELVDCVRNHRSPWAEPGMWHWVLKAPVLFDEPIPARGSLGLWEYKEYGERR